MTSERTIEGIIGLLDKRKQQPETATVQTTNHKPLTVPKTSTPNYHHSVGENLAKGSHTATVNVKQQGEG